ncbi:MAG: CPBP family intramembrane metalloprotease [Lachnospiraceae bacterium]|nr:CPBP family intramembrane metalloprotease [Lachnospiraceae bacterium]
MKKRIYIINLAALILLGLAMQIGGAYLVNAAVAIFADTKAVADYSSFMGAVASMEPRQYVHILFVAPLVEELVFRLIFLRSGRMVMPFWAANLVQALLFGFYHSFVIQKVYGFILGLIIGCVFYYCPKIYRDRYPKDEAHKADTGRSVLDMPDCMIGVFLTIILHMTINSAGVFLTPLFSADTALSVQILAGLVLMGIASASAVYLYLQSKGRTPDVFEVIS